MLPSPRVLLSIDYEPWFALAHRYDGIADTSLRRELDGGFSRDALMPIIEKLGDAKVSFYLVGEILEWYPEIPGKIIGAGHELGLHCQIHRPLKKLDELAADIQRSAVWRKQYHVRGYRAPMIGIRESAYALLEEAGFEYSSSIYAPAGRLLRKGKIWELPVSTFRLFGNHQNYSAPRDFSLRLLASGEFPYGSSFGIGLMGRQIFRILEHELKAGHSPVVILHPYEIVSPLNWPARLRRDLFRNPLLWPFTWNKAWFLSELVRSFPVSPLRTYLDEAVALWP